MRILRRAHGRAARFAEVRGWFTRCAHQAATRWNGFNRLRPVATRGTASSRTNIAVPSQTQMKSRMTHAGPASRWARRLQTGIESDHAINLRSFGVDCSVAG